MTKLFEGIENHQPRDNVVAGNWEAAALNNQADRERIQLLLKENEKLRKELAELREFKRDLETGWI